jgi:hypothetical protein
MSHLFEHLADLPVLAFDQRNLEPWIVRVTHPPNARRRRLYSRAACSLFVAHACLRDAHTMTQLVQLFFRRIPRNFHQIRLGHVRGCLGQLVRKVSIVSEEQQTFGAVIEPANRIHARTIRRQQVHHRRPSLRIGHRGHVSARLIHHQVHVVPAHANWLAAHLDAVAIHIGFGAQFGHHVSVYGDLSRGNELFGGTS